MLSYEVGIDEILISFLLLSIRQDILASTGLSDTDLVRTLQSLACGKFRVLTKNPKGRDVNPSDTFAFNDTFTCPLAKIKIMQVASKVESNKEREETQEQVDEERRHMVEVRHRFPRGEIEAEGCSGLYSPGHEEQEDHGPQRVDLRGSSSAL